MYKWDPEVALDLIERENINVYRSAYYVLRIGRGPKENPRDISSLKDLTGGGAARPPEQVKEMKANMKDTNPELVMGSQKRML